MFCFWVIPLSPILGHTLSIIKRVYCSIFAHAHVRFPVSALFNLPCQTERKIEHNKPDIVVVNKESKECFIIDIACPFDTRIVEKEKEKIQAYTDLKYEIVKCWKEVKRVAIVPIVIVALGSVTTKLKKYLKTINFDLGIEPIQKSCLLGTARIMRKVLDTKH